MNEENKNSIPPLISVIIPCRNEKKFICNTIISLMEQVELKGELEIIVVDGMSEDGTRDILKKFSRDNSNIKIVDNIMKTTPFALNIGINNADGQFICIMGAHSKYSPDYLVKCIKLMDEHPEVSCVGGPIISEGVNYFSRATAIAMSSSIGVGDAKHRFPNYEGYAEGACFPMFRRNVFEKVGLYDESLVKNQDDEFFFRLRKSGEKVYLSSLVKSIYYVRNFPRELFRQYYQYGYWRVAVLQKHKIPFALRQLVPSFFYLAVFTLILLGLFLKNILIGLVLPALYIFTLILYSIKILFQYDIIIWINFIFAVFILHISYAIGFFASLVKIICHKKF